MLTPLPRLLSVSVVDGAFRFQCVHQPGSFIPVLLQASVMRPCSHRGQEAAWQKQKYSNESLLSWDKKSKFWFLWLLLGSACGTARGMRITEKMEGFCIFWVLERTPYFPLKTESGACLGVQYPPSGFRLPCLCCLGSRDAVGKKRQVHGQCLGFLLISFNFSVSVNFFLEFFSRCLEHSALF